MAEGEPLLFHKHDESIEGTVEAVQAHLPEEGMDSFTSLPDVLTTVVDKSNVGHEEYDCNFIFLSARPSPWHTHI